jgi:hypothetical protein
MRTVAEDAGPRGCHIGAPQTAPMATDAPNPAHPFSLATSTHRFT